MVSPGELRLLSRLERELDGVLTPTIGTDNQVVYPDAQEIVDERDLPVIETLDRLADKGVLQKEYLRKAYICPSCDLERMGYSSACPECDSVHTLSRVTARHSACGYFGPANEFVHDENTAICPGCDTGVESSNLTYDEKHVCRDCDTTFTEPQHRVQCRSCFATYCPRQVPERTFYRYSLTDHGRAWYQIRMMTRDELTKLLEERSYTIRVDVSLTNGTETYPVHVHAEPEIVGTRIVAGIDDELQPSTLDNLQRAANWVGARPLIVSTTRTISKQSYQQLQSREILLLTVQPDGTLSDEYTVREAEHSTAISHDGSSESCE